MADCRVKYVCISVVALCVIGLVACDNDKGNLSDYRRDCRLTVVYEPTPGESPPFDLIGDFNDWQPGQTRLRDADGDGLYVARLDLPPGPVFYRLRINGEDRLDTGNPLTAYDENGVEQSFARIADCSTPALRVGDVGVVDSRIEATAAFLRVELDSPLAVDSVQALARGGAVLDVTAEADPGTLVIQGALPLGKSWIDIRAEDRDGRPAEVSFPVWNEATPFTWRDAVIYQVVVDRFRRGGGSLDASASIAQYQGGDLDGVREAVEEGYFESLGANVLWLSPLYDNPDGSYLGLDNRWYEAYHGYWPIAPRTVEARFGGPEALDRLVAACHERGIRVLMDLVPNHVHVDHPYFIDHAADGWFNAPDGSCVCGRGTCSWADDIERCWFTEYLPDLDFKNLEVIEQSCSDAVAWLTRFDLDGFRIDAVPMMPRLATRHLRDALHVAGELGNERVFLLGETYTGATGHGKIRWYLGPQGLDGQFDFPLMWVLRETIAHGNGNMMDLENIIAESEAAWAGADAHMGLIVGNHDVTRFISEAAGDDTSDAWGSPPPTPSSSGVFAKLRLAYTVIMTLAGAPIIYYGDEVGLAGAGDPDCRRPFPNKNELSDLAQALRRDVGRLARARSFSWALRGGARQALKIEDDTYVYMRLAPGTDLAVVALNRGAKATQITFDIPPQAQSIISDALVDLFGTEVAWSGTTVSLTLPPRSAALLLPPGVMAKLENDEP